MNMENSIFLTAAVCIMLAVSGCSATQFELMDEQNKTCVIIETELMLSLYYNNMTNDKVPATMAINANNVTGQCDSKTAQMVITMTEPASVTVTLDFANSNDDTMLQNITVLAMVEDGEVFKKPKVTGLMEYYMVKSYRLSSSSKSFKCDSEIAITLKNESSSVWKMTRLQAFNIVNDTITSDAEVCKEDLTTPQPNTTVTTMTTATPKPTTAMPEPTAPLMNYTVSDKSGIACLMAQMRASFVVQYRTVKNATSYEDIVVPSSAKATGHCGNSTQLLSLEFNKDWKADLVFEGGIDKEYRLQNISLQYRLAKAFFPDAADSGKAFNATGSKTFFKVSSHNFYSCAVKTSFKVDERITMEVTDLKLQAFRSQNNTQFTGSEVKCEAEVPTDNIVPIIVGAALAALVLIVLVAYIIGRRRSSGSGYQSV